MRIAEIILESRPSDFWSQLKQINVNHATGILPSRSNVDWDTTCENPWDYGPLVKYRDTLESFGLNLAVMEDVPPMTKIRLGLPGRDEEIDEFKKFITNLGRIGVGVLVYDWWCGLGWQRTRHVAASRGGARVSAYSFAEQDQTMLTPYGRVSADRLWEAVKYFLDRVIPVAEAAGVKLAMHPDDPPLPQVRGIDRIMSSVDNFYRLLELHPSEANGITFCQGNFALMEKDVVKAIEQVGSTKRIYFVHFRDIIGTATDFTEAFHDAGQNDMAECVRAYQRVGYEGFLRTDHVPRLTGDETETITGYSQQARLHAVGYTQGLLEAARSR